MIACAGSCGWRFLCAGGVDRGPAWGCVLKLAILLKLRQRLWVKYTWNECGFFSQWEGVVVGRTRFYVAAATNCSSDSAFCFCWDTF